MKKRITSLLVFAALFAAVLLAAWVTADFLADRLLPQQQTLPTLPVAETVPETTAETQPEENFTLEPSPPLPPPVYEEVPAEKVYDFTPEEQELLLKLAMAERGDTFCPDCIALVMRTVLNRVESEKFSSTIKGVVYARDQFTPAMDGSLEKAQPNELCREALEKIETGWDESQGALYYEWCDGESWHSRNLTLLITHCDTRFYK